jgi:Polyketide cyclase / dehydrase and lipid transport
MSMVQQAIEVAAPLHTVYEQLATVENYPRFMHGVERVTRTGHDQTHWIMDLQGRRREFDAVITERSLDERVSWSTTDGPLVAETLTLRPIGETRTQVVAQLEADVAFLLPGDRHGPETLNRRLKSDLDTFKNLCETGKLGPHHDSAGGRQLSGRSTTIFGTGIPLDPAAPSSAAARARAARAPGRAATGGGTGGGAGGGAGGGVGGGVGGGTGEPGGHPAAGLGGGARTAGATAPMGGQAMSAKDAWGDGMINEEDRGSAHDF